jgi:hypothetical protein
VPPFTLEVKVCDCPKPRDTEMGETVTVMNGVFTVRVAWLDWAV